MRLRREGNTIGGFRYVSIDYGDTHRVSEGLKREKKNIDNREPSQCVLLHLLAGVQWGRMKLQQGTPEKQKLFLEVEEWRR